MPQVGRPGAPARGGVEAQGRAPVLLEDGHRHPQLVPGVAVGLVVGDVDPGGGAVVGDDGGDGGAGRRQVLGPDPGRNRLRVARPDVEEVAEERVRARADHLLGQAGRLGHQIEMEADGGGGAVHDVPGVQRRQDVERGEMGDRLRVVEGRADRHEGAPVVTGQREPVVPERAGERDGVGGHGALGVRVGGCGGGFVARAVSAQVGADDGVVGGEFDGDVPPHEVGLREAVQEHDRAARAADGDVEGDVAGDVVGDGDALIGEAGDGGVHGALFRRVLPASGGRISSGSAAGQQQAGAGGRAPWDGQATRSSSVCSAP